MKEIFGDIWNYYNRGNGGWLVVTTNGTVNKQGKCVMGRGIALEAANRFPTLPQLLGSKIRSDGNNVHVFPDIRVISFPVKHNWYEKADKNLIRSSLNQLVEMIASEVGPIFMVRPGCGNGNLKWEIDGIRDLVTAILDDDKFIVVDKESSSPIDILLFCPMCFTQHVDQPNPEINWDNPPHRTHQCRSCNYLWRPSDVPTNGVSKINTAGKNDQSAFPDARLGTISSVRKANADAIKNALSNVLLHEIETHRQGGPFLNEIWVNGFVAGMQHVKSFIVNQVIDGVMDDNNET